MVKFMSIRKLILAGVLLCLPLATAGAAEWTQTLKRIDESGEMNLGFRQDQPPLSFDRGGGEAAGYSVDLCKIIASEVVNTLGKESIQVNYVPVTAADRYQALQSGKIDILCGATTKSLTRAETVGFTQPIFVTGGTFLSHKGAPVEEIGDLSGKSVAVVANTTTIVALEKALETLSIDADVIPVTSTSQGMTLLERNEVDALAADQVVLIGQVISRGGRDRYLLARRLFSFEPFALAISRGDPDFQLVADRALSQLNRSGDIIAIYRLWFGSFGENPPDMLRALYQLNATPP